ncbi:Cytochrome P450 94C1 [Hondaea fermentalgiana]|uniref:Cytochrome P450 94C1 n=1 Tax=Hondaea fermentalgiana TaxID=2315210 RepID=A0A2R5G4U4_9STRA|nr:Cytochrome P450 94C1 [Hondaea fermentalgiana]|eukprot:GBG25349.1 Cytochrome P450 94C1 [Hondaea fermentalgiana]
METKVRALGRKLWLLVRLLAAGALAAALRLVLRQWRLRRLMVRKNPHLDPRPIKAGGLLGALAEVLPQWERLYDFKVDRMNKYGETYAQMMAVWTPNVLISTANPDNVKHILKTEFDIYIKSHNLERLLTSLLGKGIFVTNHGPYAADQGAAWTLQRKTASKIFTRNVFQGKMYKVFADNALKIADRLKTIDGTRAIDMQKVFFKFTMDSIGTVGFGVNLDTLDDEENAWFAESFDKAQKLSFQRFTKPFFEWLGWFYESERELFLHLAKMDRFSFEVIDERLADPDMSDKEDILSHFITHFRNEKIDCNSSTTRTFLRDVVMSFFIAGRDTTGCLLSFTFLLLGSHPEIEAKLLEEIERELPERDPADFTPPKLEQLKRGFPYLTGLVNESLRLFPPVPSDGKMACRDDVLPDGTFVPAGATVNFDIYSMGHSEKLWGPDVKEPRPERWILPDGSKREVSEWMFPVFQPGKRKCLGADLAVFEAKVLIVELVRRFSFKMERPPLNPPYATGITMTVNGGLPMIATPRHRDN